MTQNTVAASSMNLPNLKFVPIFLTLLTAAVMCQESKSESDHVAYLEPEIENVHVSSQPEVTRSNRQLPVEINSGDIIRDYAYNFLNFMLNYVGILAHTLVTQLFFTV